MSNKIVIVVEGGLVQEVLACKPTEYVVIDYDTEGADESEIVQIPSSDTPREAVIGHWGHAEVVDSNRAQEILDACESAGNMEMPSDR